MAIYENGVFIDNQIEDGDPSFMESERYVQIVKVARATGSFVKRVAQTPKRAHNKALHIIDQFDRATGRM